MKNLLSLLLLLSITAFMSCKGDMGDMGPAGQDGVDGTNGINGTNGQNGQPGQPGQDGNANVKSFDTWFPSSAWASNGSYENKLEFDVSIITQAVAEHGMVMVYLKTSALGLDGNAWTAMPFSLAYQFYTEAFSFSFVPGKLFLRETSNDGLPVEPECYCRVIAVTSQGLARNPDVDWTNYELVKTRLQLAD